MPFTATHLTAPELFDQPRLDIEDEAYRHLFRARRLAVGDELRVVDGGGRARRGLILAVDRRSATVELGDSLPSLEPRLRVRLLVGALRPERASWLVEKVTELGAESLVFIATERTPRDYGVGKLNRWRRVAAAAVEQSGRSVMPRIDGVVPISHALAEVEGPIRSLQPAAPPLAGELASVGDRVTLVVGPEGGLSDADSGLVEEKGGRAAGLGEAILRVETAAVAALSCALFR